MIYSIDLHPVSVLDVLVHCSPRLILNSIRQTTPIQKCPFTTPCFHLRYKERLWSSSVSRLCRSRMGSGTYTALARAACRLYREYRTARRGFTDRLSISPANWYI